MNSPSTMRPHAVEQMQSDGCPRPATAEEVNQILENVAQISRSLTELDEVLPHVALPIEPGTLPGPDSGSAAASIRQAASAIQVGSWKVQETRAWLHDHKLWQVAAAVGGGCLAPACITLAAPVSRPDSLFMTLCVLVPCGALCAWLVSLLIFDRD